MHIMNAAADEDTINKITSGTLSYPEYNSIENIFIMAAGIIPAAIFFAQNEARPFGGRIEYIPSFRSFI